MAPSKSKKPKSKKASKLISLRLPADVIAKLRKQANKSGKLGYQQLIKLYIENGLSPEDLHGSGLSSRAAAAKRPAITKSLKYHDFIADPIIEGDIAHLAKSLSPYLKCFAGKKFLVTGAFGFLGRYMVHLFKYLNDHVLDEKVNAILLDNFVTGYVQQVVLDKHLVFQRHNVIEPYKLEGDVDYILHMAGIASPAYYTKYPIETMDVGTIGTRNMLDLAVQKSVKSFLFTSSSEVYGDPDPAHVPTKEGYFGNVSVDGPRACYDESKRFGETMCNAYWRVFNVPVKVVRPFNVYGPGIRPDDYRVLPNFIEHALRKEPLPIHGQGINTRSFCYINDAVEAIFRVLFSKYSGEAFNVGNPGPEISVTDLAKLVVKCMPYKLDILHIEPPHAVYATSDPKRRCPDISKISKLTGFKPKYTLEEGLQRTIQWFMKR